MPVRLVGDAHESWIPVPIPATIGVLADVLAKTFEVLWSRPVRVIHAYGIRDLVQRREALWSTGHEIANAPRAALLARSRAMISLRFSFIDFDLR